MLFSICNETVESWNRTTYKSLEPHRPRAVEACFAFPLSDLYSSGWYSMVCTTGDCCVVHTRYQIYFCTTPTSRLNIEILLGRVHKAR